MATELVTDNGISYVAGIIFTGIFTLLGVIVKGIVDVKRKADDAKEEASKATESAVKAAKNTVNVSNGFASDVNDKLDAIGTDIKDLSRAFRGHLEWHLNQDAQKRKEHKW